MTTWQVYGDAIDDSVFSADSSVYANARAGTGDSGVAFLGSTTALAAGQAGPGVVGVYIIYQALLAFDTSAVTAGSDSNVSITVSAIDTTNLSTAKDFEIRETDWDETLGDASVSFIPGASISGKTLFGSATVATTDTSKTFTSALTTIPRATYYEVALVPTDQRTNTSPGASGRHIISFASGDVGATDAPLLQFDVGGGGGSASNPPIPPIRRYFGNLGR